MIQAGWSWIMHTANQRCACVSVWHFCLLIQACFCMHVTATAGLYIRGQHSFSHVFYFNKEAFITWIKYRVGYHIFACLFPYGFNFPTSINCFVNNLLFWSHCHVMEGHPQGWDGVEPVSSCSKCTARWLELPEGPTLEQGTQNPGANVCSDLGQLPLVWN